LILVGMVASAVFQYPVSDRMGCNFLKNLAEAVFPTVFQYPVSDRMGCNDMKKSSGRPRWNLSVSCVGSNGLQPIAAPCITHSEQLSVSCVGSNGLQLRARRCRPHPRQSFSILCRIEWAATPEVVVRVDKNTLFQYPVSDRMGCNTYDSVLVGFELPTFSILCRIEWAATSQEVLGLPLRVRLSVSCVGSNGLQLQPGHCRAVPKRDFQYPVSDRMGCNVHPRQEGRPSSDFQYPVSDRMGCNYVVNVSLTTGDLPFSILCRIEWAATSVSIPPPPPGRGLSVSCVGSNGLQPRVLTRAWAFPTPFSILCRIEWAATCTAPNARRR